MTIELENIKKNAHLVKELCEFIQQKLGFEQKPSIVFLINKENADDPLGRTAYYSPDEGKVAVYIVNRHIKDVLRSIAHELVHHAQHCRGEFDATTTTTEGYAQQDEHLREMEREAYESGNMIFRDWEDGIKSQKRGESNG